MTCAAAPAHDGWTSFRTLLFPARRAASARHPYRDRADGERLLDAMSPHERADLPAFHDAA